jgi:hypothetical protein
MIQKLKSLFTRRRYKNKTQIIVSVAEDDIKFDFSFDQSSFDELVFLFLRLYSGNAAEKLYESIYEELANRDMLNDFNKMVYILQSIQSQPETEDEEPLVSPAQVFVNKQEV